MITDIVIRDQVVLDTLRHHPWSTPSMLHKTILHETGGPPTMLTGAVSIMPWEVYACLRRLERQKQGRTARRHAAQPALARNLVALLFTGSDSHSPTNDVHEKEKDPDGDRGPAREVRRV